MDPEREAIDAFAALCDRAWQRAEDELRRARWRKKPPPAETTPWEHIGFAMTKAMRAAIAAGWWKAP